MAGEEEGLGLGVGVEEATVFGPRTTALHELELYSNLIRLSEPQTMAISSTPLTVTTKFPSPLTEKTSLKPSTGTADHDTKFRNNLHGCRGRVGWNIA